MKKRRIVPYLFILPAILLVAVFFYYAIIYAFYYSLTDYQFGYKANFIGLENYLHFFRDPVMIQSLLNQMVITVWSIVSSILFPLVAAELLFFIRSERIGEALKKMFVFPMLVPGLVTMLIWKYMYNVNFGFNTMLDLVGLHNLTHDWMNESSTAMVSLLFIGFPYVSGLFFLMFHAGLNAIGKELHDSVVIDGCNSLQIVRYLHIPALRPYFYVTAVLSTIGSFQNYGMILATTRGGPGYDTLTPSLHMYNVSFSSYGSMGYGCAIGVIIFLFILALSILGRKLTVEE